jgi:predicted phosphoribosyltransferase
MPFRNRSEAGRRLAVALAGYKEQEPSILALPRGGVAVAAEVAAALDAPLEIVCLEEDSVFGAIGFYYRDFRQVSDEEVIEILQRFPAGKLRKSSLAGGVTKDGP